MVDDGLKSRQQINKFLSRQEDLPPSTLEDWSRLEQIRVVLNKFNELALFVSVDITS
jgi:CMP-2-keto-3-deoxyoctulosonic acid synthetase